MHRQALRLRKMLFGNKHEQIVNSVCHLAKVLNACGKSADAEATYLEALAMSRKVLGEFHPDNANALDGLEYIRWDRGDFSGARNFWNQALVMKRDQRGEDDPEVMALIKRIGPPDTIRGDWASQEMWYRTVLEKEMKT